MPYRQQKQPGCGGCLLILLIFIFLTGGSTGLLKFINVIALSGMFLVISAIALFWGFSYWIKKKVSTYEQSQSESHNRFVWLLVHILIDIAKIDGVVTRDEVATIRRFFQVNLHYKQAQLLWLKELIKEAIDSTATRESLLQEFRTTFAYEPRLILLELVYQILFTKGKVPDEELQVARNIASYLEISAYDQRTIEAKYTYNHHHSATSHNSAERAYATLGLEPGTDQATIKKAYRKLSMKYHPDKVRHLGEEFRGVAETKMKEINDAYDYFKKNKP